MSKAKPLILILEDEKKIADMVVEILEQNEMHTQVFHKVANVLPFLKKNYVNLMLLDVSLPDGTGFDALQLARNEGIQTPAIFLTATNTEADKVRGLNLGADDYIPKPFSFAELLARINAVLRRTETLHDNKVTQNVSVSTEPFDFCGAEINPTRLEAAFPGDVIEKIGKKELGILRYLYDNKGEVITRRALIHAVWGEHADVKSRSLDQYIVKIRDLLSKHGLNKDEFRTIHGVC